MPYLTLGPQCLRLLVERGGGGVELLRDRVFVGAALLSLLLVGLVDLAAGPGMSVSLFYVVPLMELAVAGGRVLGTLAAAAAAAVELGIEAFLSGPSAVLTWDALSHLILYLAVAAIVSRLAEQRAAESRLLRELEAEHARVEELSRRDVTGLHNSRYFFLRLAEALEQARTADHPVSIVALDVDNLKQVNDTLGHRQGDLLIQAVADGIAEATGRHYLSARLGGDEFAILMPGAGKEEAMALAKVVVQHVHGLGVPGLGASPSVSVGVATAPAGAADGDELLHRADLAMYSGKRMGGGRVVLG